MTNISLRAATAADRELLARATLENLNWNGPRLSMSDVRGTRRLRHYYDGWPGHDDFGLIAVSGDGRGIAAVWLRYFTAADPGYGFVSEDIPELSVWVAAEHRGRGIGGSLLQSAAAAARARGITAISLSVEDGNPAARLYDRHGFRPAPNGTPGCLLVEL